MVIQLRIDDRLIHGEVVTIWLNYTNADVAMVVDDETANNAMMKSAMKLAQPAGVSMPIVTIQRAIDLLNEKGDGPKKIFVITKNAQNARKIVEGTKCIQEVNAGALRSSPGKKQVDLKVFVDDKDIEDLKAIESLGVKVYSQTKPDMKVISLDEIISKAK